MDKAELSKLIDSIDKQIPVFRDFFKHQPTEASATVSKIFELISKIVNLAMRQSERDLDGFRYCLFIKLLELTFTGPDIFDRIPEIFTSILVFYTSRFNSHSRSDKSIASTNEMVLILVNRLVCADKFFRPQNQLAFFYKFLKMTIASTADAFMSYAFHKI